MADNKGEEATREEVVTSLNNHDVNNHDVNNHCAVELKEDQANHTESNDALKEPVEENNHVAMVPNSCDNVISSVCSDAVAGKSSCEETVSPMVAPDVQTDATPTSNISGSQKDDSFCQNDSTSQDDSGVKIDIESDIADSKDSPSNLQTRTDSSVGAVDSEMVDIDKTAYKLDSACSMIPIPDSNSDPHQHSDCSSSSRSSKDVFMDAQEDITNDWSKNIDVSMSRKDDSGIDVDQTPGKASGTKSAESTTPSATQCEASSSDQSSPNNVSEQLDESYSSLPSGTSKKDKLSVADAVAEAFVADFDTSSDTGNAASYDVTRPVHSDSDSDDMANIQIRSRKRVRSRNRLSSSSSSSTEGPDEANEEEKKKSSDEEEEEMETENERVPTGKWHPILETRNREIGFSNTVPLSYMFARRTNCSLSLVQRLKLQYKLEYHDGCVNALHFNKSGTLLASGSDDMNIVLWRWDQNKPYIVFESGHRSNVFQAKFMPYTGDTHIVSCARDGMVRLAELSSTGICKGTRKLAQHKGAAHKLAIQQDASHLFYSCGEDAVTYEIDLRQDKPNKLCTTKQNDKRIALYSIHANPFKSFEFVVGGRDHFVRIYDKRMLDENEGNPVKKFCPHHLVDSDIKANVTCAVYNYNGSEVLGTYNDEDIYLFDNDHSDGADFIKRYKGHRNNATVKGVNFYGPHSEYIITGSDCGNIFLWDKETEKVVQYFHGDEGGVINVLEPHPHFPILATSGLDHDVKVWAPTAREPTELEGLKDVMRRNKKERREERIHNDPEMMDGQMLWLLMQHLRRTSRRNARRDGEEVSSSSSNSDNDDDDSDNSGEDGNEPPVSCVQS